MFLLVPAYPGCPGSKAVKRSLLLLLLLYKNRNKTRMQVIVALPYQVSIHSRYQMGNLGTSGHWNSTPMFAFDWEGMSSC